VELITKFVSRKLLAAIGGVVVLVSGALDPEQQKELIKVLIAYISGQSAVDVFQVFKRWKEAQ